MLMVNGQPRASALGNFYFSPVRLRPVFEPTYFERPRQKRTDSNLDLSLDVKPKLRHKGSTSKTHSMVDDGDDDDNDDDDDDDDDGGGEDSIEARKAPKHNTKKKSHRKDKRRKMKAHEDSKVNPTLEHLCSKLRLSFVLGALGVIVLLACCCAIFLRNRLVACCKRCWPGKRKKNPSKVNLFDVEEGEYPYQASNKLSSKQSKKNKNPPRLINTATQDSRTTMAQEESPTPVGCSPCCKKKRTKSGKRRRK
ncbi:uncharacterized protein LOC131668191 [Phymastichus coffea]|uniref:uncharacterized protein LOC131668191 n=1 Tax=Phymastichus coffea TaxID=108790 RepID=UPI00273B1F5C|nr:uncharacterized protein LOC131668191 [Phymastichus coffea]